VKVVVTGATGYLGRPVCEALRARGDDVVALARSSGADLELQGAWMDALDGAAAVVHLAGEPIAGKRWTARQKQIIRDSRVETTRHVVEAIARARARPGVLVTASGADYYAAALPGEFDDDAVTEADPPGDGFLARVCRDWEAEARAAEPLGVRVVRMRCGLVLGPDGGALARMKAPFSRLGSGRQWVSWIALADAVAGYVAAIDDPRYRGPINLVAGSVRNAELARALHRVGVPVPAFALRAALGEMADPLLEGRNVVPAKLDELGFRFTHRELGAALAATRAGTSERAG